MTFHRTLALLTLAGCSFVVLDRSLRHTTPPPGCETLSDSQLAEVHGVDKEYMPMHNMSCEQSGMDDYGTLGGSNYVGASECDSTNSGPGSSKTCIKCEENVTRQMGVLVGTVPLGTGEWISGETTSCGRLRRGSCGEIPNTSPVLYGCRNTSFVINPAYGTEYACSDLGGYTEAQTTEH